MTRNPDHPTLFRRMALAASIVAALLVPARSGAADKSPVQGVRTGADRLVVIATRLGEIHLDGTFETRSGHALVFDGGKLVKATDAAKRLQRVDKASIDDAGRLVIGSGKDTWKVEEGEYRKQGDPEPQPRPDPEPQPRPNPNSFTVADGKIVELTY